MKTFLVMVILGVAIYLGFETYDSARFYEVSLSCVEAEAKDSRCVSLGPLGVVNTAGVEFWVVSFIDHGIDIPVKLRNKMRS
jgi:hypothetical protein